MNLSTQAYASLTVQARNAATQLLVCWAQSCPVLQPCAATQNTELLNAAR